jgi:hypothetical protein
MVVASGSRHRSCPFACVTERTTLKMVVDSNPNTDGDAVVAPSPVPVAELSG